MIDNLFHADDAALINTSVAEAMERLTVLAKALTEQADMRINVGKTKVMHTQQTLIVERPTAADYKLKENAELLKEKCEGCGRCFVNKHGLSMHQGRWCDWFSRLDSPNYSVDRILQSRDPLEHRFYFVSWTGYGTEHDCWVPAHWCDCDTKINKFWSAQGLCVEDIMPEAPNPISPFNDSSGKKHGFNHRCVWCCKFFKTGAALKSHHTKSPANHGCKCKPASRTGTLAEKAVMRLKRKELQKQFGQVIFQGEPLENVLHFLYLGSEFEADGDTMQAVKVRMAIAKQQFGKFTSIWMAQEISMVQKLKLFSAGVVSVLTHGHESWTMHPKILTSLTNWCARCLSVITGRSIPDEHRHPSFDLVAKLRARRLRWAGQVLRQDTDQSRAW